MYQDILLRYSKDTRYQVAALTVAGVTRRNPACGDEIELGVKVEDASGVHIEYRAQACAITLASAAILAEALTGCSRLEARKRLSAALQYFAGGEDGEVLWSAEPMRALGAVRAFPMRMACVRLPWEACGQSLN